MEATRVASTAGRRGDDPTGLGDDVHVAAASGDVPALRHMLRAAPERVHAKDRDFGRLASKNWLFFASRGLVGLAEFGARRNLRFSSLVLKEMNCWIFVVICCILGLETRLLLLMNLPLRSEGN